MADLRDDRFGDSFSLRYREEVCEITAGHAGESKMFAVGRSLEPLENCRDGIKVRVVKWHIGSDRQADAVGRQRDPADQIKNLRPQPRAPVDAMINGDLENIEMVQVLARPIGDGRAKSD